MKLNASLPAPATTQSAASRPLVLAVVFFVLGAALAGGWFYYQKTQSGAGHGGLPEAARTQLSNLAAPVTIHFYAVLPAGSASDELKAFADRVEQLLAAANEASGGKLLVTRLDAGSDTNAAAAAAEGIQAFNLDKGDACFLGLTLTSGANKETIAQLQPEWESALPYDLVRTILRVAAAPAPAPVPREVAQPSAEIVNSIKTLIPDVNATSAEEADQIFHSEFLKECAVAGTEMETAIRDAQDQVVKAQGSGSPEELAAAQNNLLKVQLAQGEKLKQIAADLQTRMAVFQKMKAEAANAAK
ncbi:MAG TPA: Gldg family protein [bacterium]|nr:Gldg family protein [bacterium]